MNMHRKRATLDDGAYRDDCGCSEGNHEGHIMTNRQKKIGKFAPNRAEQPPFERNAWRALPAPKQQPPTRQQRRASARKLAKQRARAIG